ncbi:hypothetical protein HY642_00410 [Candidatus Woesearchaeota archaeon]|nr:hypothetical protein [Candidatus Woesearchaeota archaeon]
MSDFYFSILEDIGKLGLGRATAKDLATLGDQLRNRMQAIAKALPKLEKQGWQWTTGSRAIYLHNGAISERTALAQLKKAGLPMKLVHAVR